MFTGLMLFLIPNQPSVRRLKQDVLPRYSGIRQIELLMFFYIVSLINVCIIIIIIIINPSRLPRYNIRVFDLL